MTARSEAEQPGLSEADIQAIRDRLAAVVPYVAVASPKPGDFECPLCEGDGRTEGVRFDAKGEASTIVAYGIGEWLGKARAWVEQAPKDITTLLSALTASRAALRSSEAEVERLREAESKHSDAVREVVRALTMEWCVSEPGQVDGDLLMQLGALTGVEWPTDKEVEEAAAQALEEG